MCVCIYIYIYILKASLEEAGLLPLLGLVLRLHVRLGAPANIKVF